MPIQYPRIPVRKLGFHEEVFPAVELLVETSLSLLAALLPEGPLQSVQVLGSK